jgi:HNH endonuclease
VSRRKQDYCRRGHPLIAANLYEGWLSSGRPYRKCRACHLITNAKRQRIPAAEALSMISEHHLRLFWSKVDRSDIDGCWPWTACLDSYGYGQFGFSPPGKNATVKAHRLAYTVLRGPVPPGQTLDHTCRVRHCVNPAHLEPVTRRENTMRSPIAPAAINAAKTHCHRGHPFNAENTHIAVWPDGFRRRVCRACRRLADRSRIERTAS